MLPAVVLTLASGVAALVLFLYFWKRGQFDDVEDIKYQLFRDEDDDE